MCGVGHSRCVSGRLTSRATAPRQPAPGAMTSPATTLPRPAEPSEAFDSADLIRVTGGTPLTGEVSVRGAKNLVPKAMVAALLGDGPSLLRNVPQISDVRIVTGLLEAHGVSVRQGEQPGTCPRPHLGGPSRPRRDRRARRVQPDPDPALRPAAAPDRPRLHPGPRRLPDRRPADRLPPRRAALLRRRGGQAPRGPAHLGPAAAARHQDRRCPTRASAPPSRCC